MKKVILWVAATVVSSQTLYFSAEAAILVAAAACDGAHAVGVSLPFVFKRLSCLLLHVLDALAEDDDGVPRARAPLRLCVP